MRKVNCVFEGGGIKGITFIGCIKKLEEENIEIKNVAGTSVGALVASLVAAGYNSKELEKIMIDFEFQKLNGFNFYNRIPIIGKPTSMLTRKGVYSTKTLEKWVEKLLLSKGVRSFKDLKNELKIVAADVTNKKIIVMPDELDNYGYNDDFSVAKAVTMSCSIPFYFEPYRLDDNLVVDGGIISSFPIWLFKNDENSTLGFLIDEDKKRSNNSNVIKYIYSVIETMTSRDDFVSNYNYATNKTVKIKIDNNIQATDFNLTVNQKTGLYKAGYDATTKFIEKIY